MTAGRRKTVLTTRELAAVAILAAIGRGQAAACRTDLPT